MTDTTTKTLTATLAEPTTHKERKLRALVSTYREALHEAFDAGADTMSAVNDIVTPYDLPYQAKDAIKSYVPQLLNSFEAKNLTEGQAIRLVNRAATFDRDSDRTHEICWEVPQSGHQSNNFWIPLRIDPAQEELWDSLLDDDTDVTAGELRLLDEYPNWRLHVTVHCPPEIVQLPEAPTPIGFDVGESLLVTGCALQHGSPTKPMLVDGSQTKNLRKEMFTTLRRLQERDAEWRIMERSSYYENRLDNIVETASREAVSYAHEFDSPVIVLEDLANLQEEMDYGNYLNRRLHAWAFSRLQRRIEEKAREASIPVRYVNPEYTSQICHACGYLGSRPEQATFRCENSDCYITEFQADINAAANIAGRLNPWGESLPWKSEGDDSPRDGSRSDTATRHARE